MWLSPPPVIGIIISLICGMSRQNICNPDKKNKFTNQWMFTTFVFKAWMVFPLPVCDLTLPHPPRFPDLHVLLPVRWQKEASGSCQWLLEHKIKSLLCFIEVWGKSGPTHTLFSPFLGNEPRTHTIWLLASKKTFDKAGNVDSPVLSLWRCRRQSLGRGGWNGNPNYA